MRNVSSIPIRKILIVTMAMLIILTIFRMMWLQIFTPPNEPRAVQGLLDLRNWHHLSTHSVSLKGEWEFYPQALLYREQPTESQQTHVHEYIQVPGSWNFSSDKRESYGYGTYRLRILIDPLQREPYAVHLPKLNSSSEVFVNGERQAQAGTVGRDRQSSDPLDIPYTIYFSTDELDEIELVIHVANFENPFEGGLVASPKLGYAEQIDIEMNRELVIVLIACSIYLVNACYSLIIYFMGKRGRRDQRLLDFACIFLLVIIATLMAEGLLFTWIPVDFAWSVKAVNLGLLAGGYFMLRLIKQQLPSAWRGKWYNRYVILIGLMGILTLFLSMPAVIFLTYINSILTFIPCLLAIATAFNMITSVNRDNFFLFLGAVASVYSFFWLIIIEAFHIEFPSYPFDLLIAILCFAVYFFRQYFLALETTEHMMAELQVADKHKDRFLVSVAHEMKNPLHSILNISQTVAQRERTVLQERSIRDLELLVNVGRRMSMTLNDLLELERVRDKRISVLMQDVYVHSVAEYVVDVLRLMADGKQIRLVNRIPEDYPLVLADENRLNQVLFNLIHNAVKYSEGNEVSVDAAIHEGWAKISVSDDGVGIDRDLLDELFEPYRQADQGRPSYESGIGLGLSICKQLVEVLGGSLEINSKVNEGSIFSFTLQLAAPYSSSGQSQNTSSEMQEEQIVTASEAAETPEGSVTPEIAVTTEGAIMPENVTKKEEKKLASRQPDMIHGESIRILTVDDDLVNLNVLENILTVYHCKISSVTNGDAALAMLEQGEWDLVIADVMMPKMSGFELTSRIREKFTVSELPILLLTAYNQDEGVEAGFRAGANDYISKPMNAVELVSRVMSLVRMKRSVSERTRMEAAWLQAQIKPHFIINTFNSIAALGRKDLDHMDEMLAELSRYIRLSIDFQNSDGVAPLQRELELVRSYLYIQQKRFGDRMHVIWEMDEGIEISIPPLTIQPLVENAISHGILKRITGGEIRIILRNREDHMSVSIIDNGVGMSREIMEGLLERNAHHKSGIGLLNVDRRLRRFYGKGLKIESELGAGTTVAFDIPRKF